VKHAVPAAPLWVGSGVTSENVVTLLDTVDGVIVGSAFEKNGKAGAEVVPEQVRRLVDVVRSRHA
jgi:predicted TIM-barrel enzyme